MNDRPLGGHAVDDESLRPTARRLAADLLGGRVRSVASGWRAWVLTCTGGAELILAAGLCLITGRALPWLVSPALYGVLALSLGLLRPRLLRARLERCVRLNG